MLDILGFLAMSLGASADPLLFIPAIIAGWTLRDWRLVAVAIIAIALSNELLVVIISADFLHYQFGRMLGPRLFGATLLAFLAFGIKRLSARGRR
jgi:uncharacterized membrane protein